jgi:hypothetical protein
MGSDNCTKSQRKLLRKEYRARDAHILRDARDCLASQGFEIPRDAESVRPDAITQLQDISLPDGSVVIVVSKETIAEYQETRDKAKKKRAKKKRAVRVGHVFVHSQKHCVFYSESHQRFVANLPYQQLGFLIDSDTYDTKLKWKVAASQLEKEIGQGAEPNDALRKRALMEAKQSPHLLDYR